MTKKKTTKNTSTPGYKPDLFEDKRKVVPFVQHLGKIPAESPTKIYGIKKLIPVVSYNNLVNMELITKYSKYEVGWMFYGTHTIKDETAYIILKELYVPKQFINSTHNQFHSEIDQLIQEKQENTNLYFNGWGHSHCSLGIGTNPSGLDDVTFIGGKYGGENHDGFAKNNAFFVRIITHRTECIRMDVAMNLGKALYVKYNSPIHVAHSNDPILTVDEIKAMFEEKLTYRLGNSFTNDFKQEDQNIISKKDQERLKKAASEEEVKEIIRPYVDTK